MKRFFAAAVAITSCLSPCSGAMAEVGQLTVTSTSIQNNKLIDEKFAFCAPDGPGKTRNGGNTSPQLAWSGAPKGTKSFAIVVVDPDVPEKFDDANKEGKTIAEAFPRKNFYHWVLVDIPANITSLAEGVGKEPMNSLPSSYKGIPLTNDFASFMKDRPAKEFIGYDGPCPPWNDKRLHHYHFKIYALDVGMIGAAEASIGKDVVKDIEKHALAKGEIVGTYSNFVK